eukprot:CAMPEP_0194510914 /NCGR_PEP_ID=MMETSP0253-20130528/42403_1 /TAXON_ID=2966 /ORGANISM="Noctiluca scintillans" /LENGTH=114 /DNA_ID=CAMNT_0039354195 /DNA_START=80 /DNA_END=424 /DNA_ORIENTATION=-
MMLNRLKHMLGHIEAARDTSQAASDMKKLFNAYDNNQNGFLEVEEFDILLDQLTEYFLSKKKTNGQEDTGKKTRVRTWLKQWLDPNEDGTCSKEELESALKLLLDANNKSQKSK